MRLHAIAMKEQTCTQTHTDTQSHNITLIRDATVPKYGFLFPIICTFVLYSAACQCFVYYYYYCYYYRYYYSYKDYSY